MTTLSPRTAWRPRGRAAGWRAARDGATALSYGFFLLSNAALVYDVMEGGPGQYLSDYAIILDQRMTPGQILDRLAHASFTLPILARHGALVAAGALAALLGYAALGRVERRSRALGASPGAEGAP
jgi:hypothetical protein